jgi:Polyketide cyclase / dehydrase and lipid transport
MKTRRVVYAFAAFIVLVAAVLGLAAMKPATLTIDRAIDVHAPPERIFPLVDDLRRWPAWPADADEAKAARTYGPTAAGKGATATWAGTGNAGAGRMEITESTPPSHVTVVVDFRKPFVAHNVNDFSLERRADGTRVTWSWRGTNVFILKMMSVFVSPDRMMGKHFEAGLDALKKRAESIAP